MTAPLLPTGKNEFGEEALFFLLLLAVGGAVYFRALFFGFLDSWDDPLYVVNNVAAHGFSIEHLKSAFTRFYVGNYAPLQIVSYMVDYTLWGLNPGGYVFGNILLHAGNSYLLLRLLRRLAFPVFPALLAAGIFLLHPVQVESVVWISQRKNVLALFFVLLATLCYVSYLESSGRRRKADYLLALIFFAAALLSKSVAVVLPPLLLLYDLCIKGRKFAGSIPDKLPFLLLALLFAWLAMLSQSQEYGGGGRADFHGGSAWTTLLTMLPVFVTYARMMVVPVDLSIVYAPPIRTAVDIDVVVAALLLLVMVFFGHRLLKRNRSAFFWYASIPLTILPVAQIVPLVTLMNDRYLYFPMVGFGACFGLVAWHLQDSLTPRSRRLLATGAVAALIAYGYASSQRVLVWQTPASLWGDAVAKQPGSAVAWLALGETKAKSGDLGSAIAYAETARGICRGSECYHALEKLTMFHLTEGDDSAAESSADEMIRLFPKDANGYILKGYIRYRQGDTDVAELLFTKGIGLDPKQPSALSALGSIYLTTGRPELAIEKFRAAERVGVPSAELYLNLARAESALKNRGETLNNLDRALRLGYNRQEQIMQNPDFAWLRNDPGFVELMRNHSRK